MRHQIIQPRPVTATAQAIGLKVQAEDRTRDRAESEAAALETDKRLLMALHERRGLLVLKAWLGEAERYAEQLTIGGRR